MLKYLSHSIQNFTSLRGRARRAEYAYFQFFFISVIITYIIGMITIIFSWIASLGFNEEVLNLTDPIIEMLDFSTPSNSFFLWTLLKWWFLPSVFFSILSIAFLAVEVRRWHDLGKSGLWVIAHWAILLIPFFGRLAALACSIYLMVAEGKTGKNSYGEDPKRKRVAIKKRIYTRNVAKPMTIKKKTTQEET